MHDEDNLKGLTVRSPDRTDAWKVFGDGHLLEEANSEAFKQCKLALQASVDEVYMAWQHGIIPAEADFKAWFHALTLESANSLENFPLMFN